MATKKTGGKETFTMSGNRRRQEEVASENRKKFKQGGGKFPTRTPERALFEADRQGVGDSLEAQQLRVVLALTKAHHDAVKNVTSGIKKTSKKK
jgi:hypothetical protein